MSIAGPPEDQAQKVPLTVSGVTFLRRQSQLIRFYSSVFKLASWADDQDRANAKLWALLDDLQEEEQQEIEELRASTRLMDSLRAELRLILEIIITRSVDSFQTYIGHVLSEIFRTRPETI